VDLLHKTSHRSGHSLPSTLDREIMQPTTLLITNLHELCVKM
jgi:hypothetical protein